MGAFYTNVMPWGDRLLVRGVDSEGVRYSHSYRYEPTLYSPTDKPIKSYRTLDGRSVKPVNFTKIKEARAWMEAQHNSKLEFFGFELFQYTWIYENYRNEIDWDAGKIVVANIDIEVASDKGFPDIHIADKEVTAITVKHLDNMVVAFGCGDYTPPDKSVVYIRCKDENDLLLKFLKFWQFIKPDVITGWNVGRFDVPYIINRITRTLSEENAQRFSPWNKIQETMVEFNGNKTRVPHPVGIAVLDYLDLYKSKKFVQENRESYRLDYIAHVELNERKLDFSEFSSLLDLYTNNFQKFMQYNIHDVQLVDRLEKKLGLLNLVFLIAYRSKVNYVDALGSVRQWDVILHNYLMDRGIVVPAKQEPRREILEGAYVKETQVGMHEWLVSLDLDSLYPHLIMQFNISPETHRGRIKEPISLDKILDGGLTEVLPNLKRAELTCAANLALYDRRKKGFLPECLEEMYRERVQYKKAMIAAEKEYQQNKKKSAKEQAIRYKNIQKAIKVNLNAAYGVLTNRYFRYYSHPNAEAVTLSGQLAIRWIEDRLNQYMNQLLGTQGQDYIIAMDTDSVYLNLAALVKKRGPQTKEGIVEFVDSTIQHQIIPLIEGWYGELAQYTNSLTQRMAMKRESIADKGLWTGKKRYILNIWDKEGVRYSEPEIEIKGIECVRSTTPECCRNKIREGIWIIMNRNEQAMIDFITEFQNEFANLPFEDVSTPTGINGLNLYGDSRDIYRSGTPMHVKGALIHNMLLEKLGITQLQPIYDGDKIKFTALVTPNPVNATVIAAHDYLPKEFELDRYIDRDTQFDKGFLQPIKRILDVIGWHTEKLATIEKFLVY